MKFSIARGELLESLGVVTKALSSRTTLPILSGVLVSCTGDVVVLQSTDLEISIRTQVGANVEEPGAVVLPGRLLAEVVRSLPEAAVRIETSSFDSVKVSCGTTSFTLRSLSPDDFPKFPEVTADKRVTIATDVLAGLVRKVSKAVSRDESRPVLTGVLTIVEGTTVRAVATDSYRLAVAETSIEEPLEERIEAVIPGKALEEVPRLASGAENVTIGVADNQVVFEFGRSVYVTRRIEGSFPNWRQLIPESGDTRVRIDRGELEEAVKRVSLLAQHNAPIRLKVTDSTVSLSAQTQDVGDATEDIMAATEGEELEIAFNHSFLADGISSADGGEVLFVASSPLKPGILRAAEGDGFIYLIMPVRP